MTGMQDVKVASVCMKVVPREWERNLERIHALAREASKGGAQVVCFPELCVTGYLLRHPNDIYSEAGARRIIDILIRLAREIGVILCVGLIEVFKDQRPCITQVLAGPGGLLGLYRKTHLSPAEKDGFRPGREIKVFSCGSLTFGIELCYEAHFPEISTILALKGAHLIMIPHASPRGEPQEKFQSWLRHLPARAFDNGVFVVACNQVGGESGGLSFPGVALILGPDGNALAHYAGDKEKILFAELKAEALDEVRDHRMKYFLPQRRGELYGRILGPSK